MVFPVFNPFIQQESCHFYAKKQNLICVYKRSRVRAHMHPTFQHHPSNNEVCTVVSVITEMRLSPILEMNFYILKFAGKYVHQQESHTYINIYIDIYIISIEINIYY